MQLTDLQQLYKAYAAEQQFDQQPHRLYQPLSYILSLGGKATRPVLVLAGCGVFSDELKAALPAAFGVELFHNFSLMHDDIMDAAPTRRGKPTVHVQYDNNTAILSGDAMLVCAYQYIGQVQPELLPAVFRIFNETALGVCEGQRYDMNFETQAQVSIPDYIEMIRLKTAVLLHGSLQIGALIGGANAAQAALLGDFGTNIGIAFQLQDDYLDTYGDADKFGKRIGGDIVQNKKTYLYLRALELAQSRPDLLQTFLHWTSRSVPAEEEDAKIAAVTAIYTQLGIPAETQAQMQHYHQKGMESLRALGQFVPKERLQILEDLAAQLLGREK